MALSDIKNLKINDRYLNLVRKDVKKIFNFKNFVLSVCPACRHKKFKKEFNKNGFFYVSCVKCNTLYANPRPTLEMLKKFYSSSDSTDFWVEKFFKPVAESRRKIIFKPRAKYASSLLNGKNNVIGDIGAGFGLFLEELRKLRPDNEYIAIEPSEKMSDICKRKNIITKCAYMEDLPNSHKKFDLLCAFELIEHLLDPYSFLKKTYNLLNGNGQLLLTTLNSKGFDILLLWEKSKCIAPPHHINFFNIDSAAYLLEKIGFEIVEVSTPGIYDWDIVQSQMHHYEIAGQRLWNIIAKEKDDFCKQGLQKWIRGNNLSSHMRILAKKR